MENFSFYVLLVIVALALLNLLAGIVNFKARPKFAKCSLAVAGVLGFFFVVLAMN